MPLPQPISEMALVATPPEPLKAFLGAMGFKSLVAKVESPVEVAASDGPAPPPARPFDLDGYELILTEERLQWWAVEAILRGTVAVDTETDELGAMSAGLCGVSLALEPGLACYIPIDHRGDGLLSERPAATRARTAASRARPDAGGPRQRSRSARTSNMI